MNLSQRLRTCAKHTGLDAVIELLTEAADEIDRLSAGQPADVTDAEIEALFGKCGGHWSGDQWVIEDADLHPFVRTILALRPVQVPMTDKQAIEMNDAAFDKYMTQDARAIELVRSVEAHHGIKPKEQA